MHRVWFGSVAIALIAFSPLEAQQPLSKQVQADIIFQEISGAISSNKPKEALDGITRYRRLGVALAPKLMFVEARLALITGDAIRAEAAMAEYLRAATNVDPSYNEAVRLYPEITRKAEADRQRAKIQADERRRTTTIGCLARALATTSSQAVSGLTLNGASQSAAIVGGGATTSGCWGITERDLSVLEDFELGKMADLKNIVAEARQAASSGDNVAALLLAMAPVGNEDVAAIPDRLRKAADAGLPRAQAYLGRLYSYGNYGIVKDTSQALQWYRRAAEAGSRHAMEELGDTYYYGHFTSEDYSESLRWHRRAAEAGSNESMLRIGYIYQYGKGVPKDDAQSAQWMRRAADAGNAEAMHEIGSAYWFGEGVAQSKDEAIRWFRKAADAGYGPVPDWAH